MSRFARADVEGGFLADTVNRLHDTQKKEHAPPPRLHIKGGIYHDRERPEQAEYLPRRCHVLCTVRSKTADLRSSTPLSREIRENANM
jgi:hypothetical protein